ncbi:uncharacterized protein ACB058_020673 [Synchiropus picturatus]
MTVDHKVPFIVEEDEAEYGDDSTQRGAPLLQASLSSSPVHQPCLSSLLCEDVRHVNTLRLCRSPVQGGGANEDLSPSNPDFTQRLPKLLMPSMPCVSPLSLSPRVVDGIEDNGRSFHFNVEQSETKLNTAEQLQVSANLLLETEEVRQNVNKLGTEVSTLNQEVSSLAKELHSILHLLQSHIHCQSPVAYSCGVTTDAASSGDWHVSVNAASGLHSCQEAVNHPIRSVCGCSGSCQRNSTPPLSSCLHLCCTEREGCPQNLPSHCGPLQSSRTTPNSPCLSHCHTQRGPSLLGFSAALNPFMCQSPAVVYSNSIATTGSSTPVCSLVTTVQSHPLKAESDLALVQNSSLTPIHSTVTPTGQSQLRTSFSSFGGQNLHG